MVANEQGSHIRGDPRQARGSAGALVQVLDEKQKFGSGSWRWARLATIFDIPGNRKIHFVRS